MHIILRASHETELNFIQIEVFVILVASLFEKYKSFVHDVSEEPVWKPWILLFRRPKGTYPRTGFQTFRMIKFKLLENYIFVRELFV